MRRTGLIAATCLTAACYNYQPLSTPAPEPGTFLSVTLTDAGSEELARYLGPNVFEVRGRCLGESDRGLLVSVSSVETKRGDELTWAGETVALPSSAVLDFRVRRLAKGRSALLVGAGVTGLVATTAAFVINGGGSALSSEKGRPNPQ